ncbi:Plasma membrane sulfite pump involved in sulfite metabolism [Neophaeococcomyces mojaviensis]|uniref:Plasma membrane sulfite pump involved in sulfite metabolism n=1 Tax=Neophaeococcomyces mojaviensis TaxID=3383035 RepID=A0ACC3AJV0_9EURO|nr:Plasma membrane sulfite pump involved in sulfite metabolism [Knufia sp. JES_112]
MDDQQLERLASNNPAMTMPANVRLPEAADCSTSVQDDSLGSAGGTKILSDPAGDITKVRSATSFRPKSKYDVGWRRVVRNFSPSWFSVTMGTGIVSVLLFTIPFHANWLYWLSVFFLVLNLIIFALAATISVIRYTVYPEIWTVMIHDPTNSLFLGTIPMGFATIIEGIIFLCCPYWGPWATTFAWVLWMIDSVASFAVTVSLSFILISQSHLQSLDRITAAQLLPIAATIVASGTGAEVAEALLKYHGSPRYALGTLIASYIMWGMSTPFAIFTLVIYYQRLAVHKLPPREIIVSSFLPLGPLGMGGYTVMYLGAQAREVLPLVPPFLSHIPVAGDILYILGIFIALIMWAFGLVWFVYALAAIYSCGSFPFNMGWWGFTFPLGVMAASTIQLGVEFPSLFFRVLGTAFAVMVIILWIVVFAGTIKGAWSGQLFYAPCLKNLPKDRKHGACVKDDSQENKVRRKMANETDLEKGD